jgi:2-iminobutanoate/2-iminopropanoate deaminase
MQFIAPSTMATPKGHYSPAVVHNGIVYVAGQLPMNEKGEAQLGTIEEQTALCLHNIEQILLASGSDMKQILKMNVYLSDISLWAQVNQTYAKILGDHKPARAIIPCGLLNRGCLIEIDCIAAVK